MPGKKIIKIINLRKKSADADTRKKRKYRPADISVDPRSEHLTTPDTPPQRHHLTWTKWCPPGREDADPVGGALHQAAAQQHVLRRDHHGLQDHGRHQHPGVASRLPVPRDPQGGRLREVLPARGGPRARRGRRPHEQSVPFTVFVFFLCYFYLVLIERLFIMFKYQRMQRGTVPGIGHPPLEEKSNTNSK